MNVQRRFFVLWLVGSALLAQVAHAQALFWVETNFPVPLARTSSTGGSNLWSIPLTAGSLPEGVAFHSGLQKVYWVEAAFSGARILRANPNYTGIQVLVSDGSSFRGIALHESAGKMYWTSSNQADGAQILRANVDGTNVQVVLDLPPGSNPRGIALDLTANKIYWADVGLGKVSRCSIDGSMVEDIVVGGTPWGVAINGTTGHVYWTNYGQGEISRWPLAGGSTQLIKSELSNPTYLVFETGGGRMYWIEAGVGAQRLRSSPPSPSGTISDLPVTVTTYGGVAYSSSSVVDAPLPEPVTQFALDPVTPNPASRFARIEFALPQPAHVRLTAVDVRGREVATLVDRDLPAGRHHAEWTAGDGVAPGVYFLRLLAPGIERVQRCVLLP